MKTFEETVREMKKESRNAAKATAKEAARQIMVKIGNHEDVENVDDFRNACKNAASWMTGKTAQKWTDFAYYMREAFERGDRAAMYNEARGVFESR